MAVPPRRGGEAFKAERYTPDFPRGALVRLLIQLWVPINSYFASSPRRRQPQRVKVYNIRKKKKNALSMWYVGGWAPYGHILYEHDGGRLSWGWIMMTWQRWHIGFIHYFTHIFKLYQNIKFSLIWTQFNPPLRYEDFVTYILDESSLFVRGSTTICGLTACVTIWFVH